MIQKLAHKVTVEMINENIISIQQAQFYEYAFIIRVENIITILSILAIALCNEILGPTVIFLIFFLGLRKKTGGYHAKTFLRCYVVSNIIFSFIVTIAYPFFIQKGLIFSLTIGTLASVLIFILGTINHPNWNLNLKEYLQMKSSARKMICVEYFFFLISFIWSIDESYIIFMSLAIMLCAITLIFAKVSKQSIKTED